ncbi:MAG: amino acid permease [Myxococcales bacterium FL481]|nr:MAG: amino acid permease [Myxococcales bacterium FL481]
MTTSPGLAHASAMHKLERSLDLPTVIAFAIGAMLGGEIFVLPALGASTTGSSVWLAFVAAAALVLPAALSKSELATAIPGSGGSYLYIERCLGPVIGTVAGIGLWLSLMLKCAFAMTVLMTYLGRLVDLPGPWIALGLVVGLTGLNVLGVRKVGRFQNLIVSGCVLCLTGLVVAGIIDVGQRRGLDGLAWLGPAPFFARDTEGFLSAVGLVFVSYAGVTKVTAIAEEVKNESRNIPLGILISLVFMCLLYAGISWVLVTSYSPAVLAEDAAPVASLANRLLGPTGERVINAAAVVALISMVNAGLLAASRFPFAMARDQLLPPRFHQINRRFVTPVTSILVTGLAIIAAITWLDVTRIVKLASVFMIAAFMLVNVSLLILRESDAQWYRPRFRAPLYPYVQILGTLTGLILLWAVGTVALEGLLTAAVAGGVVYLLYGRRHARRIGVLQQLMSRRDIIASPPVAPDNQPSELPGAHTVVPLFGTEVSPEALVHLGATLAERRELEVIRISDVPDQTVLEVDLLAGDRIASLRRRVLALAGERGIPTQFDSLVTRDVRRTLYEYANRANSRWFVMAWRESGPIIRNPYEWLYTHLPCNVALFKDAGIRTYRRLLAVVEPGPHDALVARTADQLSTLFRAQVTLARVLPEPDETAMGQAEEYLTQLGRLCHGTPAHELCVGQDWCAAVSKASARFDLILFGAPPDRPLRATFLRSKEDRLMNEAHCAVLRLKTPREEMHEAVSTAPASAHHLVLDDTLAVRAARAKLEVERKDQLFAEFGRLFGDLTEVSPLAITKAFEERELLQNTAMGEGVAMPHGTLSGLDRTHLAVVTLARPIQYGANAPEVDVCVATLGPPTDRETHLRLIAGMSKLMVLTDVLNRLREASDGPGILAAIERAQDQLAAHDHSRES